MAELGLRGLFVDELKDLYNAENQLVKALPKMAKASKSPELRAGFEEHFEQTKGHVERLENIFSKLGENPKGKKCKGMEGLVEEGAEAIEDYQGAVRDAALIGGAQRVEHYEIAGYGTVIAMAKQLSESGHAKLLEQTLTERKRDGCQVDLSVRESECDRGRHRRAEQGSRSKCKENRIPSCRVSQAGTKLTWTGLRDELVAKPDRR